MRLILFLSLLLCSLSIFAQKKGEIQIIQDPKIDSLIAKRIELYTVKKNSSAPKVASTQIGYRVQIYYGSDRRKMFNEQSNFRNIYPNINTYIIYKEPNYHLKVGDFRTRLEAQNFLNELKSSYRTLFIYKEKINPPPLEEPN